MTSTEAIARRPVHSFLEGDAYFSAIRLTSFVGGGLLTLDSVLANIFISISVERDNESKEAKAKNF
jgi:hypothetical protein